MNQWISTPEATNYNQSQGFIVQSIRVDNLSASWLYLHEANYYVPPYYYGVVVNIPGTDAPTIEWKTPPTINPNPVGTGQARIEFFDVTQSPSPGILVYNQAQISQFLGTYKTNNGVFQEDGPFIIPPGMQSVLVLYPNLSLGPSPGEIAIIGNQTQNQVGMMPMPRTQAYAAAQGDNNLAWTQVFPSGAGDTTFSIFHEDNDITPQTVRVVAVLSPLPLAVSVELDPSQTLNVDISGPIPLAVHIEDGSSATLAAVTGANAVKVDGSAVTQPISGSTSIKDGASATLATVTAGNAVKVDGSAVTQPVSGTVTANQGTTSGTAWPVELTPGSTAATSRVILNRLIATTTIVAAVAGKTIKVLSYRFTLRPPAAGVNDGTGQLIGHTSSTILDQFEYNETSAAGLGSIEVASNYKYPELMTPNLNVGEALDLKLAFDAGSFSVSGYVEYTQS